jgi:hypothetical protein
MQKFKNVIRFILVMPPAFLLFYSDRLVYLLLPHMGQPDFRTWINKEHVVHAIMRISGILSLYFLYQLFL